MSIDIWCVIEHRGGEVDPDSLQLLGAARQLEATAIAVVCADAPAGLVEQLGGAPDRVLACRHRALADFTPDGYANALEPLARERRPAAILTLHSHFLGRDLAPVLATRLETGLLTDCIDLQWSDGLVGRRLVYRRKLVATQEVVGDPPHVATCQRGAFAAASGQGGPEVEELSPDLDESTLRWSLVEYDEVEAEGADITEADIVVAGGRGVGEREEWRLVEELARSLGGAVAASRPVVDQGWVDRSLQVGSSGKTVRPRLYVAAGISGAIQHVVGMRDSDVIVAVNKDARAPIFEYADYGIVGDLHDVLPKLTERIRELKGADSG